MLERAPASITILQGDVRAVLASLPSAYFDCVVTSPPYWGLRDYGVEGQIGLERTLGEHLQVMVGVFREVRRVLKAHGTLWLNYGDCYAAAPNGKSAAAYKADGTDDRTFRDKPFSTVGPVFDPAAHGDRGEKGNIYRRSSNANSPGGIVAGGFLKPKDLCMIPNRLAIALQDDGWWVRSEIIWHKPNPMPESTYDRPTSAHEKVWLLTKSEDYFYNHEAIREACGGNKHARKAGPSSRQNIDRIPVSHKASTGVGWGHQDEVAGKPRGRGRIKVPGGWDTKAGAHGTINRSGRTEAEYKEVGVGPRSAEDNDAFRKAKKGFHASTTDLTETKNARNVWTIAPRAYRDAHFATFPPALAERCMKAGVPALSCSFCGNALPQVACQGVCRVIPPVPGRVLDPFGGAGTVGLVAQQLGVDATLIELNPAYVEMTRRRLGLGSETQILEAAE